VLSRTVSPGLLLARSRLPRNLFQAFVFKLSNFKNFRTLTLTLDFRLSSFLPNFQTLKNHLPIPRYYSEFAGPRRRDVGSDRELGHASAAVAWSAAGRSSAEGRARSRRRPGTRPGGAPAGWRWSGRAADAPPWGRGPGQRAGQADEGSGVVGRGDEGQADEESEERGVRQKNRDKTGYGGFCAAT
jgi:hypothetical protein